ncbi:unnamed protein product [Prorocentrum cordatum]|uniref:Post-GPI attachment to proteins factor 3 n=1 Tax=Prorocentrum cordatum TaxID=2364126 RepID=A0ABN9QIX6_9DINO|nr:unnamed protein product [Polarella glacialis]
MIIVPLVGHQLFYGANILAINFNFMPYSTAGSWHRPRIGYEIIATITWSIIVYLAVRTHTNDNRWRGYGVDLRCCAIVCLFAAWFNSFVFTVAARHLEPSVRAPVAVTGSKRATAATSVLIGPMCLLFLAAVSRDPSKDMPPHSRGTAVSSPLQSPRSASAHCRRG